MLGLNCQNKPNGFPHVVYCVVELKLYFLPFFSVFSPFLCLGLVESVSNVLLHHLLLIARHYIYTCKLKNFIPTLQVYLQLLLTSMKIEKKIALENRTLNSFEGKWKPLKDALQY